MKIDSWTMPGHPIDGANFKDINAFNRYRCPECDLFLKEPVQFSCGHRICRSCAEEIITKHVSPLCPQADCGEPVNEEDGARVSYYKLVACIGP